MAYNYMIIIQESCVPHRMSIHIKDSEDLKNKLAEAGEKLVVIDFMATWCGPCKMIGPKLDEMANEMADSIVVLKVDVDECEDIATEYNINSMPTFVFVKSSKKLEEFSGANVDKLKNTILKHNARIRLHNFAIPTGTQDLMVKIRQEQCATASESKQDTNISVEKPQVLVLEPSLPVQVPTTANPTTSLPVQVPTICEPTTDSLKMLVLEPSLPVQVPTTANPTTSLPVQVPTICEPTTDSLKMPRTKGILKELDLSKSLELTPKKLKLYKRCRRNLSEIRRLRKKIKKQPRALFKTLTTNSNVQSLMDKNISGPFALLLQSQLQNTPRKLTGRRWSIDDKVMALSIYKRSTGCYRLLRRLFCLPSEGTLKALLNRIPMKCGINSQIFKTIKDITKNREPEENLCILAFDEMSIRKHLQYNSKQDVIDGYQDHGNQGRTMEPATHALLFMAIGIRKKWKQPLAFYFSGDCVTADRLSVLIKEVSMQYS
ncbi:unnamed protein product [Parnassius apollo]|uniref:(apollo) hypothetical protein n=1 Tax=Parnassius apollo TaxID=110799 RepID=A0A8S3WH08_PARAO|nr:unnamed protein product [Parnassius apollo]